MVVPLSSGLENVVPCGASAWPTLKFSEDLLDDMSCHSIPPSSLCQGDYSSDHNHVFVADACNRQFLAQENAGLLLENAKLRQRMALMTENAALVQAKERLEQQLRASSAGSAVKQPESLTDRLSRKERRQNFMKRAREKAATAGAQHICIARVDVPSDCGKAAGLPVLLGSRLTSFAEDKDANETMSNEGEPARQRSRTAAMMQNIPLDYTREGLLKLIDEQGFRGCYNLLYLPIAFQTEENHGYAFINFTTTENYELFREHFSGFRYWNVPSDKICEVAASDKFFNLDDHIEGYRNSPIMHESVEERFKPVLCENGQRMPFPEPTKKIKAPRCKKGLNQQQTDCSEGNLSAYCPTM